MYEKRKEWSAAEIFWLFWRRYDVLGVPVAVELGGVMKVVEPR